MTITTDALLDQVSLFGNVVNGATVAQSSIALTLGLIDGPDDPRTYWLGVHEGYMIGFGVNEVANLRVAEQVYGAVQDDQPQRIIDNLDRNHATQERRRAVLWASGVLTGYFKATADHPDADECRMCDRRIVSGFDPEVSCMCGTFCGERDCFNDWDHERLCLNEQRADDLAWS